jgi:RNA polymerase sigma-70 factor (ECF subfamily)
VITRVPTGNEVGAGMPATSEIDLAPPRPRPSSREPEPRPRARTSDDTRLRALFEAQYDFVWRSLRRLGLPEAAADDAAQQVWLVAARRLPEVREGAERSFLFATAMNVAATARRAAARRRDQLAAEALDDPEDPRPLADAALDEERRRAALDRVLDELPIELRAVLVLFELEELQTAEIAELLELPAGTVASRLRRAREELQVVLKRLRARGEIPGGTR